MRRSWGWARPARSSRQPSIKATHLGKKVGCAAPGGIRSPAAIGNRAVWATNIDATGNVIVKATSSSATDECLLKTSAIGIVPGLIVNTGTNPVTKYVVPKQAKLLDCAAGIVIYRVGSTINGIRIATGKTAVLLTGTKVAAISPKGLAWATGSVLHWRPAATAFAPLS